MESARTMQTTRSVIGTGATVVKVLATASDGLAQTAFATRPESPSAKVCLGKQQQQRQQLKSRVESKKFASRVILVSILNSTCLI